MTFILIFLLAIILVIGGVVLIRKRGSASESRLKQITGTDKRVAQKEGSDVVTRLLAGIDTILTKSKKGSKIARDLASADLKVRVVEFLVMKIATGIIGAGVGAFAGRADVRAAIAVGIGCAIFGSFVPELYLSNLSKKRIADFNAQLGDTITMLSNSLRGGYAFLQSCELVARDANPPVSTEFKRVVQEVGLGRTTEEALGSLLRRMPSTDLDLLVTAVNIQQEVGGNLAQILDSIGNTVRERVRIKQEVETLTAQGRVSGYMVTGLPVAMGLYISSVNPTYMAPLFSWGMPPDHWCCMPMAAGAMIICGYIVMQKIVTIEV